MSYLTAINALISEIDTSWNHLRGKGDIAVAVGVKVGALDIYFNSNKGGPQ